MKTLARLLALTAGVVIAGVTFAEAADPCKQPSATAEATQKPNTTGTSGTSMPPPSQVPVEASAIVPSADNHNQSAAPTVQQNGKSVEANMDCMKDGKKPG